MFNTRSDMTFSEWCRAAGYSAAGEMILGSALHRGTHLAWRLGEDPAIHRKAREESPTLAVVPTPRERFDGLMNRQRGLLFRLREVEKLIAAAKERGVEPVTPDTLTTDQSMGLGVHANASRNVRLSDAVSAWHHHRDPAALALIIDALNAEAR